MFHFLKNKETLLKEKTAKLLTKNNKYKAITKSQIKKVGILTTHAISQQYNLKEMVEDTLQVRNSKMYSLKDFSKYDEPSYTHFSEKDISKSGKILNTSFEIFLNNPFDLLITFVDTADLYIQYTTVRSKANYKVGFANISKDLYDLEVVGKITNINEFLFEVKRYLLIMNKLPKTKNSTSKRNL